MHFRVLRTTTNLLCSLNAQQVNRGTYVPLSRHPIITCGSSDPAFGWQASCAAAVPCGRSLRPTPFVCGRCSRSTAVSDDSGLANVWVMYLVVWLEIALLQHAFPHTARSRINILCDRNKGFVVDLTIEDLPNAFAFTDVVLILLFISLSVPLVCLAVEVDSFVANPGCACLCVSP